LGKDVAKLAYNVNIVLGPLQEVHDLVLRALLRQY
jgi:hypothetical protein